MQINNLNHKFQSKNLLFYNQDLIYFICLKNYSKINSFNQNIFNPYLTFNKFNKK